MIIPSKIVFGPVNRPNCGLADFETQVITIDVDKLLVMFYVHELLHLKNPTWGEWRVQSKEDKIMSKMTRAEIERLASWVRRKAVRE